MVTTLTPDTVRPDAAVLPTRGDVRSAIPAECFELSLPRALMHLAISMALVVGLVAGAAALLPMTWMWLPVWVLYAAATGTAGTGLWVLAHECGHGAFARNKVLQDTVGFTLHSALLVPYYSWQRSHALHHAKTNHMDEGETHVPARTTDGGGQSDAAMRDRLGPDAFTFLRIARTLVMGWPSYLLAGATGGPVRGRTNHFWPIAPFESDLFPPRWRARVWASAAGVLAVLAGLVAWAVAAGSVVPVLLLYVGPYLVVNMWLVGYTWLQHTDVDIPHFAEPEWSWMLGAFQTVDRPYGRVVDLLHHRIGSTHVAHHIDHRMPHYRAAKATLAVEATYPEWYRYDPTPIPAALWRVGRDCLAVEETPDGWYYTNLRDQLR